MAKAAFPRRSATEHHQENQTPAPLDIMQSDLSLRVDVDRHTAAPGGSAPPQLQAVESDTPIVLEGHGPSGRLTITRRLWVWVPGSIEAALIELLMVTLLAVAVVVLGHTVVQSLHAGPFSIRVTEAINSVLLIVILVELRETIRHQAHKTTDNDAVLTKNFLVIGMVSAIRHLLTLGAQLSLIPEDAPFVHHEVLMLEIALNTGRCCCARVWS